MHSFKSLSLTFVIYLITALYNSGSAYAGSPRGARLYTQDGITGTTFRTWAPNAQAVHVAGTVNGWSSTATPLAPEGSRGVWSTDLSGVAAGEQYKWVITTTNNPTLWKTNTAALGFDGSEYMNAVVWSTSTLTNAFAIQHLFLSGDTGDSSYTDLGLSTTLLRGTWVIEAGVKTLTGLEGVDSTEVFFGSEWAF